MNEWHRGGRPEQRRGQGFEGGYGRGERQSRQGGGEGRSFEYRQSGYGQDWRGRQADLSDEGTAGDYGAEGYARYGYGGGRQSPYAHNAPLERVTDGEAKPHLFGDHGEHRGRGPKNYVRSDERIREDVNDRLSEDSWLDASDIEVAVSGCEVTLGGTVASRQDRRRAEDLAEMVGGVKHVQNNLRVQDGSAAGRATGQGLDTEPRTGRTGLLS